MTTNNFTLNQPGYGSSSPTWDQPLNANASLIDQALSYTTPLQSQGALVLFLRQAHLLQVLVLQT